MMNESRQDPAKEGQAQNPRSERDIAEELRLRADPPRVIRLSRKALTVLAAGGGLGLAAILIFALQDRSSIDGPDELISTERVQEAEGLTRLPRDYGSVPQLRPPLPGELGRPILSAPQPALRRGQHGYARRCARSRSDNACEWGNFVPLTGGYGAA